MPSYFQQWIKNSAISSCLMQSAHGNLYGVLNLDVFFKSQLFLTTHTYKSHIVIYDVETGEKLSKKLVELQDRGVALIRHINALDSAHIVCSVGRDLQVIPCNLKLKID